MSRLAVYSEAPGGGDRVYLDTVGTVSGLRFTTAFPGGDSTAEWQMALDLTTDHRALAPGRRIGIPIGTTSAWTGTLQSPQRGDVWSLNAVGRASDAKNYQASAPTTGNALALNEVVDAAISRGLGWTRPSSLPSVTNADQQTASVTLEDALGQVADALGQWWSISRSLAVTMSALPTTLSYILMAADTAGGRTLEGFVTDVYVTYLDWMTYVPTTILRSATSRPFGRVEYPLDITNLNAIPVAQAQSAGDAYLAKNGARLKFTGGFTAAPGQLLNPGGTPVDPATVVAGTLMRVLLTDPDSAAGEVAVGAVQIVIGQTDYDVDSDTLVLTPLDVAQQVSIGEAFAGRAAPSVDKPLQLAYMQPPGMATVSETVQVSFPTVVGTQDYSVAAVYVRTYQSAPNPTATISSPSGQAKLAGVRVSSPTTTGCTVLVSLASAATGVTTITVNVQVMQN